MEYISNQEYLSGEVWSNSSAIRSLEERVNYLEEELYKLKYADIKTFNDYYNKYGDDYILDKNIYPLELVFLNNLLFEWIGLKDVISIHDIFVILRYRNYGNYDRAGQTKITLGQIKKECELYLEDLRKGDNEVNNV